MVLSMMIISARVIRGHGFMFGLDLLPICTPAPLQFDFLSHARCDRLPIYTKSPR